MNQSNSRFLMSKISWFMTSQTSSSLMKMRSKRTHCLCQVRLHLAATLVICPIFWSNRQIHSLRKPLTRMLRSLTSILTQIKPMICSSRKTNCSSTTCQTYFASRSKWPSDHTILRTISSLRISSYSQLWFSMLRKRKKRCKNKSASIAISSTIWSKVEGGVVILRMRIQLQGCWMMLDHPFLAKISYSVISQVENSWIPSMHQESLLITMLMATWTLLTPKWRTWSVSCKHGPRKTEEWTS